MKVLRIYSQLLFITYSTVYYIYHVVPYVPNIYLTTLSLYFFYYCHLIPPSLTVASNNQKSDFFLYEFVFEA